MAIKSLKNKITSLASGEILGEADKLEEKGRAPKKRPSKPKKNRKEPKPKRSREKKVKSQPRDNFLNRRGEKPELEVEKIEESPVEEKPIQSPIKESVEGYEDVLSILGVKENLDVEADFLASDLDYIEFSQATPLGFDFQEVTDFISRVKYTLDKYESALSQRNKDLIIVASEVKKVEQRMVEANQAKELERMVGGMTEEERLIEENLDLRIEINELKNRLASSGQDGNVSQLKKSLELLESENNMLKSGLFPSDEDGSSEKPSQPSSLDLPNLEGENVTNDEDLNGNFSMPELDTVSQEEQKIDIMDSMIEDMGGMYNDEQ